ncbi:hypothetical protein [Ruegeria sp. HKCCA4633]|uniref:hypothetical protein n=1 Tax=Ruegeria sp. HKCCA4633 TaxID=2682983 RepID=UPI00148871FE|nr:hypothetical protein [Ruegeria sp. HKCCA4633]
MIRVAIVCNGAIPGSNVPNIAQGARAVGLQIGFLSNGFHCDIVSSKESVISQLELWETGSLRFTENWRVLERSAITRVLQQEYDIVVFMNWSSVDFYEKSSKNKLVYDFLSASLIEHRFVSAPKKIDEFKERKEKLLRQADFVIGNGPEITTYAMNYVRGLGLADVPDPISVGMSFPWTKADAPKSSKLRVFCGGFDQAWTKGLRFEDLSYLAEVSNVEIVGIGVGTSSYLRGEERWVSKQQVIPGSILHDVAPYETYRDLNSQCHVALDVFEENEERQLSHSTRAITSLCCGCPVVTMSFTGIGKRIAETNAGWTMDTFSLFELSKLLRQLSESPEDVLLKAQNTRVFWEHYSDPVKEIEPFVALLRENI